MNSNPNDLLERYLQSIGQFFPLSVPEDTLAELRANLLDQMDARAEELKHALTEEEKAAILRSHGRPEVVAARYLPQRSLIGPALFPVYLFTLRRALPLVVAIYAIARGIALVFAPAGPLRISEILAAVGQLVPTLILFWATVTIVFAVIELVQSQRSEISKQAAVNDWDPRKLPAVKADGVRTKRRSLTSRVADLVVHCLWMLYVLAIPAHPFLIIGPGRQYVESRGVRFAPVWHTFFLLVLVLLLIQLLMKVIAIVNQDHVLLRSLQICTDLLSVFACGTMAVAGEYFVAVSPAANLVTLANVNHGMAIAFRIILVFAVIGLLTDSWKSVKRFIPAERLAF